MTSENSVVIYHDQMEAERDIEGDYDALELSARERGFYKCEVDGCNAPRMDDDIDCPRHALETAIDDLRDLMADDHRTFRQVNRLVGRIAALKALTRGAR